MVLLTNTQLIYGGGVTKDKNYYSYDNARERDEKKKELENRGYKKIYTGEYNALRGKVYYLYY